MPLPLPQPVLSLKATAHFGVAAAPQDYFGAVGSDDNGPNNSKSGVSDWEIFEEDTMGVPLDPNGVEVDVSCESTCLLVLTDLYDPNWRATLDGAPVDVTPVNYLFRGVRVTPGRHRIVFEYRPLSFRIGAGITGAAVLLVLALLIRRR
jgi:hypothetical protein